MAKHRKKRAKTGASFFGELEAFAQAIPKQEIPSMFTMAGMGKVKPETALFLSLSKSIIDFAMGKLFPGISLPTMKAKKTERELGRAEVIHEITNPPLN